MRKVGAAAFAALGFGVLIGCSTFRDQSKAMVGGGAVAGQDYINGLTPSEKSRTYFAQNASDESKAVTISRTGDGANDTGVRFVANGGIVIPPGASITFENKGYCCDPHLPAPKAGDEFQFVKTTQLIPEELQGIYRKLLTKASNGDEATLNSMQKLVWALRTAGTEAGYANNLTDKEKKILNSCSEYEGEFELYCSEKLALSRFWKKLLAQADAYTTVNIGGVTYQASDLLDDKVGEKKIKAHLGQLITLGESMPVEHTGFNYGELASGIYTDIKGTGPLEFKATVANSTSQNFTFYPMDYIAQVGSGVSDESASVVYFATSSTTQKQRVTIEPQDEVEVEEEKDCSSWHSDKQRKLRVMENAIYTMAKSNEDAFFWNKIRVGIRSGCQTVGWLFGPEVALPVAGAWMTYDGFEGELEDKDVISTANDVESGAILDEAIRRYSIAARAKNAAAVENLQMLKNASAGLQGASVGVGVLGYGFDMKDAENLHERGVRVLKEYEKKLISLKRSVCPICGRK